MAAIRPDDEILTISSAYRPPTRPVRWTGVPLLLVLEIEKALRAGQRAGKKIFVPCASNTFLVLRLVDYLVRRGVLRGKWGMKKRQRVCMHRAGLAQQARRCRDGIAIVRCLGRTYVFWWWCTVRCWFVGAGAPCECVMGCTGTDGRRGVVGVVLQCAAPCGSAAFTATIREKEDPGPLHAPPAV